MVLKIQLSYQWPPYMVYLRPTLSNSQYLGSAYYESDPYLLSLSLVLPAIRVKKGFSPLFSQRFLFVCFVCCFHYRK